MKRTYLLDTSIVSIPTMKAQSPRVIACLTQKSSECVIGAPVWHELSYDAISCRRPQGKRRTAIQSYLTDVVARSFPILPYDTSAAFWCAMARARLEKLGKKAPFADGQSLTLSNRDRNDLVQRLTR